MSAESPLGAFFNVTPVTAVQRPEIEKPVQELPLTEPTPEEARAVEAVFAQQQESQVVAGLLGIWTSALVLHDLAVETFSAPADEDNRRRKHKKDESEDPSL
ncbi:MAG TPA: hypothetical protein VNK04_01455 [Gemmataceae bacterium]|nr:hypothetical protein [Gemmataceae bacterium]